MTSRRYTFLISTMYYCIKRFKTQTIILQLIGTQYTRFLSRRRFHRARLLPLRAAIHKRRSARLGRLARSFVHRTMGIIVARRARPARSDRNSAPRDLTRTTRPLVARRRRGVCADAAKPTRDIRTFSSVKLVCESVHCFIAAPISISCNEQRTKVVSW